MSNKFLTDAHVFDAAACGVSEGSLSCGSEGQGCLGIYK